MKNASDRDQVPSTSPAWQVGRPNRHAADDPAGLLDWRPSPTATPIATKLQAAPRPDTSPGMAQPPLIAPSQLLNTSSSISR